MVVPPGAAATETSGGGQGDVVVLHATQGTCDDLIDSAAEVASEQAQRQHQQQQQQQQIQQIQHQQIQQQHPPVVETASGVETAACIQAVVDLRKLSELVGVSEGEFVTGLHREANDRPYQQKEAEAEAEADAEAAEAEAEGGVSGGVDRSDHGVGEISLSDLSRPAAAALAPIAGEAQPLLPPAAPPSQQQQPPHGAHGHRRQPTATGDVALGIDAFAETLADALSVAPSAAGAATMATTIQAADEDMMDGGGTIATMTVAAASGMESNARLGHDAFLLEVPHQHDDSVQRAGGEGHDPLQQSHHFVLALPEIHVPASADDEDDVSSTTSEGSFLPMLEARLERAFSMIPTELPTDIRDVQLEATAVPHVMPAEGPPTRSHTPPPGVVTTELHLDLVVKRRVPLIGYVILFSGLLALSSVGTALDLQGDEVTPSMKTFWRVSATALALLPFAMNSVRRDGLPKLSAGQWMVFPLAALSYGYMTTAFVVALGMTSLANSFVLSNLTSLVIIAGKACVGLPVLLAEGSGAVIGFVGAAICARDPTAEHGGGGNADFDASSGGAVVDDDDVHQPHALLGDLIALSASFGMAAYIVIAKDLRPRCDVFVFMFVIMALSSVFVLLFMILTGETVLFSLHPTHGIWGWLTLSPDRLPLELYMVYVCNIVGTLGYVAVLKYFDPVVVAMVMLMEPVIAAFIGFAAGVDPLPGVQTWIGDAVVVVGSALVITSGAKKTESIDATEAIHRPGGLNKSSNTDFAAANKGGGGGGGGHVEMLKSPVIMKGPVRRGTPGTESDSEC